MPRVRADAQHTTVRELSRTLRQHAFCQVQFDQLRSRVAALEERRQKDTRTSADVENPPGAEPRYPVNKMANLVGSIRRGRKPIPAGSKLIEVVSLLIRGHD